MMDEANAILFPGYLPLAPGRGGRVGRDGGSRRLAASAARAPCCGGTVALVLPALFVGLVATPMADFD